MCSPVCRTGSADCIVTSPPYWGKRDYGVARQYGREPDPASYVATLRATFTEARRVLADDGTCWLNLGDCYSAGGGRPNRPACLPRPALASPRLPGCPAKNLLGLPWRVAFALQDDGWILRNAIVWHKPNAMPESVRDRLNCRHELIFLFVKQPAYWFDLDPIRIPPQPATARPHRRPGHPGRPRRASPRPKYGPHARQVTGASRYGPAARLAARHPTAATPATCGPSPPVRTPGRTSPPSRSTCPLRCIAAGCKPGGTVLDLFTGTGTTGLAALQLGRAFTGIELSPAFAALAADRLTRAGRPDDPGGQP